MTLLSQAAVIRTRNRTLFHCRYRQMKAMLVSSLLLTLLLLQLLRRQWLLSHQSFVVAVGAATIAAVAAVAAASEVEVAVEAEVLRFEDRSCAAVAVGEDGVTAAAAGGFDVGAR